MAISPITGAPEPDDEPVFDRGEDLPLYDDDALNVDEEGNVLPGNDELDEEPLSQDQPDAININTIRNEDRL